jgi:hypothetical protein
MGSEEDEPPAIGPDIVCGQIGYLFDRQTLISTARPEWVRRNQHGLQTANRRPAILHLAPLWQRIVLDALPTAGHVLINM